MPSSRKARQGRYKLDRQGSSIANPLEQGNRRCTNVNRQLHSIHQHLQISGKFEERALYYIFTILSNYYS